MTRHLRRIIAGLTIASAALTATALTTTTVHATTAVATTTGGSLPTPARVPAGPVVTPLDTWWG